MPLSRSAVAAIVASVSVLAAVPLARAWADPAAESTAVRQATQSAALDVPEPTLPDLTDASPLDGGKASAPRRPVKLEPERDAARLGAAEITIQALTFTFKANGYGIYTAPREQYPYARKQPIALADSGVHDAAGVRMYKIGDKLYNHPVAQASYGIENLESFILTKDQRYLDRAKTQAGRLIERAVKVGTAWYLPYPFDFNLHGDPNDRRNAPWYSAMAQGQAVTLFVRLYELTSDQTYKNAADGVFGSFLRPKGTSTPWVVWVDSLNHLWLEEYPGVSADRTLNGHIFATFGMWDYWRLTADERAKTLYRGALTTVWDYFPRYRNEKWISHYCLTHPSRLSDKYHLIHIAQLIRVLALTRGVAFLKLAETLSGDYPPPTVSGSVRFAAGTHTGVKFNSNGTVASRKTVTLSAASAAPADRRMRIYGQPGYWYRITAGTFAGYYVQERYAVVALQGRSVTYQFYPARKATMTAGKAYTGYEFAGNGAVLSSQSVAPTADTSFGAVASAWWNAREYLLAGSGPLAGRWIHRAALVV